MRWECDPNHSAAWFSAQHWGLVTVRGRFQELQVALDMEGREANAWRVSAQIEAASLDTGVHIRDRKLRGPEYLDAERFPTILFTSTRVDPDGAGGDYRLVGDLTMHGITREVALNARFNGEITDSQGRLCRGFSARTAILRSDFGIHTGPDADDEGTSDEIRVAIEVKAIWRDENAAVEQQRGHRHAE